MKLPLSLFLCLPSQTGENSVSISFIIWHTILATFQFPSTVSSLPAWLAFFRRVSRLWKGLWTHPPIKNSQADVVRRIWSHKLPMAVAAVMVVPWEQWSSDHEAEAVVPEVDGWGNLPSSFFGAWNVISWTIILNVRVELYFFIVTYWIEKGYVTPFRNTFRVRIVRSSQHFIIFSIPVLELGPALTLKVESTKSGSLMKIVFLPSGLAGRLK